MAPRDGLPAEKNFSLRDTFALGRVNLWVEWANRVLDLLMLVRHGISLGVDNNIKTLCDEKYLDGKGKVRCSMELWPMRCLHAMTSAARGAKPRIS